MNDEETMLADDLLSDDLIDEVFEDETDEDERPKCLCKYAPGFCPIHDFGME